MSAKNSKGIILLSIGIIIGFISSIIGFDIIYASFSKITLALIFFFLGLILSLVIILFYIDNLIKKSFNLKHVNETGDALSLVIENFINKRGKIEPAQITDAFKFLASKIISVKTWQWILGIITSLFIGIAGFFGSYILFKQNKLIETQNAYFQKQNTLITNQFDAQKKVEYYSYLINNDLIKEVLFIGTKDTFKYKYPSTKIPPQIRQYSLEALVDMSYSDSNFRLDLTNTLISELDLRDIDLSTTYFKNFNAASSDFSYSKMNKDSRNVNYVGASFYQDSLVKFVDSRFLDCYFHGSKFEPIIIDSSFFYETHISNPSEIDYYGNKSETYKFELTNSSFSYCRFSDFYISDIYLENLSFWGCDFYKISSGVINGNSKLINLEFENCCFSDIDFGLTYLENVSFEFPDTSSSINIVINSFSPEIWSVKIDTSYSRIKITINTNEEYKKFMDDEIFKKGYK